MDFHKKRKLPQNPRIKANIFEMLTFSWMISLFKVGRRRDLEHNDLYATLNDYNSSKLAIELEKKWSIELDNAHKSNRNPSLLKALLNMFGANYAVYGLLLCFDELVLKMSQPLFIGGLLKYFDPIASKRSNITHACTCACGLMCTMLISMVLRRSTYNEILLCGMKVRVACSSILYRKALKLSRKSLGATTAGHVVNLLSNDLNRFDDELTYLQYLWIGPLQTIVITYFLWQEIGVSSLFGIAILLFVIPLQGWLGKKTFQFRMKAAKLTDERGRLLNEIIASIQVIKMYTWEKPFSKLIEYARKKEIGQIQKITFIHAISFLYRGILIRFQMFVCVLSYVLLGYHISTQKVFVIISFYSNLQTPMTVFFCTGITILAELLATIKRIQNFLLLEEKESINRKFSSLKITRGITKNGTKPTNENLLKTKEKVVIDISNASATWEEGQNTNTLNNINLRVTSGQLVTFIGPVGAGKSSIIQLILHELPLTEGTVSVRGTISYASQEPWLFIGTVRQNILFNSPMNEERYDQVVKSCCLEHDFKQFTFGDKTIVGEKGVTLSGGQKSRINLARAIYKEADIYLLDDPLSAVDSRVGKHVYEKCIKGFLKGKICIFTTHQIQLLRNEEFIVSMEKANILAQGSYQEIMASHLDFGPLCGLSREPIIESDTIGGINSSDGVFEVSGDNNGHNKEPDEVGETRSSGHISKRVYSSYISTFGSIFIILFSFFMYIITQVLVSAVDFWITFWVNHEDNLFQNNNSTSSSDHLTDTLPSNFRQMSIIVFIVLNISLIISICIRSVISVAVCTKSSLNLHNMIFNAILRAKMFFFHSNSSGRILNRFSNDMGNIDVHLPFILMEISQMASRILGSIFVTVLVKLYFLIPTIILGSVFYLMRSFYLFTSRSMKRLEGVTRSPVLGHLNASLQGLTTIRAHKAEKSMYDKFDEHQDSHSAVWYLFVCSKQAISLWLDCICLIYISAIMFSFLLFSNHTNGAYVGLVITQMIGLVSTLQIFVLQSIMMENQMISVERVLEYTKCPQEEDNQRLSVVKKTPENWPDFGCIIFKNFSLRYSPNSPHALKNLSFKISSTEKIGIVGRTGAGKSSIIQALFRLAFDEGEIFIDDVEIHDLGLNDLRSKISVIPQDPVLYSGTMRFNLDPFNEFPDHVLWNALDEVQLKSSIENLIGGLNSKISESGSNFSVGQKQLICLARALLRKNKILILDEATANIDSQTDEFIQNTIRKNFQASTVITVAHRLNTIIDSDRVLVMDVGLVIELDHPHVLLENKDGLFYSMVEQTGRASSDLIHRVAAENFNLMYKKK